MSHAEIATALSHVAKARNYHVVAVSWEDCSRGYDGKGSISCWGTNITDVRIKDAEKRPIYTLRSENLNERIVLVSMDELALVVGNEAATSEKSFRPMKASSYLAELGKHSTHSSIPADASLSQPDVDTKVSVRFQTVFVPEDSEFTVNAYVYGSHETDNPKNLLLYCTSQGTSIYSPGGGSADLFLQMKRADGKTSTHWLKAKSSEFKVGAEQKETAETIAKAIAEGSAVAMPIGIKEMGNAFNVLMVLQLPLKQRPPTTVTRGAYDGPYMGGPCCATLAPSAGGPFVPAFNLAAAFAMSSKGPSARCGPPVVGTSTAARVSMGKVQEADWTGLESKNWARHEAEHATATITLYHAVKGGVPSAQDITAAIDQLEALYAKFAHGTRRQDATSVNAPMDIEATNPDIPKFTFAPPTNAAFPQ